jgi:hypothetical protein
LLAFLTPLLGLDLGDFYRCFAHVAGSILSF